MNPHGGREVPARSGRERCDRPGPEGQHGLVCPTAEIEPQMAAEDRLQGYHRFALCGRAFDVEGRRSSDPISCWARRLAVPRSRAVAFARHDLRRPAGGQPQADRRLNFSIVRLAGRSGGSVIGTLDVRRTVRHDSVVILSFRDGEAQAIFEGGRSRRYGGIQSVIERKLVMLDVAKVLDDLRSPPGNRLEALRGDRAGQYSIRINDPFRLCFVWSERGPTDVEIVDYH